MPRLTRQYLQDHMERDGEVTSIEQNTENPEVFTRILTDAILAKAMEQFETESEERDEVQMSIPVTVRAVDLGALGGCTEVCINVGVISVCRHKGFKGDGHGPGIR